MQRADSLEKTLILGKTEGRRRGSDEVVPGTSMFPSSKTGMSGNFWSTDTDINVDVRGDL